MSHRTQVTLSDGQYARLKEEAERSGVSLAELVRRSVDQTYGGPIAARLEGLRSSRGVWSRRRVDGATYVERMRPGLAERLRRQRR